MFESDRKGSHAPKTRFTDVKREPADSASVAKLPKRCRGISPAGDAEALCSTASCHCKK